jgi:small subunit ribosomal protein S6
VPSLKKYECAVVFAPTVGTDVLDSSTKRYTEVITSRGGTLDELDNWGKRTLAYEINHNREGFYYFYRFQGSNEILVELNRQLRIDENVLRHMIVRDDPKPQRESKRPDERVESAETHPVDAGEGK